MVKISNSAIRAKKGERRKEGKKEWKDLELTADLSVAGRGEMGRIPCLNRGTWYPVQRALLRSMNKCHCSLDTLILGIGCNLYHLLPPLNFFPPLLLLLYIYIPCPSSFCKPSRINERVILSTTPLHGRHFSFSPLFHRYFVHYVSTLAVQAEGRAMTRRRFIQIIGGEYSCLLSFFSN